MEGLGPAILNPVTVAIFPRHNIWIVALDAFKEYRCITRLDRGRVCPPPANHIRPCLAVGPKAARRDTGRHGWIRPRHVRHRFSPVSRNESATIDSDIIAAVFVDVVSIDHTDRRAKLDRLLDFPRAGFAYEGAVDRCRYVVVIVEIKCLEITQGLTLVCLGKLLPEGVFNDVCLGLPITTVL